MTDKISYDHKFRGLVVRISDEEFANLAQRECEKHSEPELLNETIRNVSYYPPDEEPDTKQKNLFSLGCGLLAAFWIVLSALIILGVIKFTELLAKWVT